MTNLGRRALGLGRSVISYPLSSTFGDAWLDLTGVRLGNRILVYGGYVTVGMAIILMVAQQTLFVRVGWLAPQLVAVHTMVTMLLYVLGWSFVLTAAVQSRRRVAFFLLALFVWGTMPQVDITTSLAVRLLFVLISTLAGAVLLVPPLRMITVRWPLLYFAGSVGLLTLFVVLDRRAAEVAYDNLYYSYTRWLIYLLSLIAGIALLDLGVTTARWSVEQLSRRFTPMPYFSILLFLIFGRLVFSLMVLLYPVVVSLGRRAEYEQFFDSNITLVTIALAEQYLLIPVLIWLALLAVLKRWNVRSVSLVFAVSMLIPIVSIGFGYASQEGRMLGDLTELTAESLGLLPPFALFVIFMTATLLSFGSRFAATEGRFLPRASRLGLTLGAILLILGSLYRNQFGELMGLENPFRENLLALQPVLYVIGLALFAIPYAIFLLIRRRQAFVGTAGLVTPTRSVWPWMDRIPPQRLLGVTLVVGLGTLAFCCACSEVLSRLFYAE